jgi:regulatory protein
VQSNKTYNIKESTEKIQHYCAIQDRCQWEVERKLQEYGLDDYVVDSLLVDLILEKYINEQRFSESFCRGKFRIKKWGRIKIKNELKKKNISENCIQIGLKQIESSEYSIVLENLYIKKKDTLKDKNQFTRKGKIVKYLLQKGFESNLIWELINKDK